MGYLTDIAHLHVYRGRKGSEPSEHLLHPFTNSVGANKDKYEILRKMETGKKRSGHVTYAQLAEMFAHDCFAQFHIRLRMKDPSGTYPTSAPGMSPRHEDVRDGSEFAAAISRIDTTAAFSPKLKAELGGLGLHFEK